MNPNNLTPATATTSADGNIETLSGRLINPGANNNPMSTPLSPIHTTTPQMAHVSLPGTLQEQAFPIFPGTQSTYPMFSSGGQLDLHATHKPIVPSTLDILPNHVQGSAAGVGGHNPSFIQSPVSPLINPILYNPSLAPNAEGLQQAMSSAPLSLGQIEAEKIPPHLIQNYGTLNPSSTLPQTTAYISNTYPAHIQLSQQQLQLLQQQNQHQLQLLQSQQQQHLFQGSNPNIQQHLAQSIYEMTSFQAQTPNKMFAEMNLSSPSVSTDFNHNVNTLPQTLPTTLNPSLKKKAFRTRLTSSIGSSSPTSPRNGSFQGLWEGYEEANTSGIGSSVCSPTTPGDVWMEYVIPQYDSPANKDQCLRCGLKVYAMEKVGPIKDTLYHKNCFTCVVCGTKLTLNTFHHNPNAMGDYNIFCASHKPRILNLASEGNAVYLAKSASVETPRVAKIQVAQGPDQKNEVDGTPNGSHTTLIKMENGENVPNIKSREKSKLHNHDEKTSNKFEGSENIMVSQANSTPERRHNIPSNDGSSPLSSSSLGLKTDLEYTERDNKTDLSADSRSDRPSSGVPGNTCSSLDDMVKSKEGNINQNNVCERTPSSGLTRQDRPSSFQRSNSNNEPVSKTILNIRHASKVLVKRHSSHEFSTLNDLRKGINPSRLLTRNESMRLDRPSQFQ